jgi:hypothetical protein
MIGLLVNLLVLVIILGIAWYIVKQLPLPAPGQTIALCILGLIAILVLLGLYTGHVPIYSLR